MSWKLESSKFLLHRREFALAALLTTGAAAVLKPRSEAQVWRG
jgi:hypothetical protein